MKAGTKFILSGKLTCANCGYLIVGESGTCRNGNIHYFYKCRHKKRILKIANHIQYQKILWKTSFII